MTDVDVRMSARELSHVISLVENDVKKRRRDHGKPRAVERREEYFARPENAGKRDVSIKHIEDGEALLTRLKAVRAGRADRIRAALRRGAAELARDFGTDDPREVNSDAYADAYADVLGDAVTIVADAFGVDESEDDVEWIEAAHAAGEVAESMRALLDGIAERMKMR